MKPGAVIQQLESWGAMTFGPRTPLHLSLLVINRWCLVTQPCLTLCNPLDYSPRSYPVHGLFQARILEWVAFPLSEDLPDPGIKPTSPVFPAFQTDSLPTEPSGRFPLLASQLWYNLKESKKGGSWLPVFCHLVGLGASGWCPGPAPPCHWLRAKVLTEVADQNTFPCWVFWCFCIAAFTGTSQHWSNEAESHMLAGQSFGAWQPPWECIQKGGYWLTGSNVLDLVNFFHSKAFITCIIWEIQNALWATLN